MDTTEKSTGFADEILEDMRFTSHIRGLKKCNQCGTCTSVCPAHRFGNGGYNPREIVKKVLADDRSVIEDKVIWECFYCYSCHKNCPQNVSPATLLQVLRERSIEQRCADEEIADFMDYAECFYTYGVGSTPNQFFPDIAREWGPKWQRMRADIEKIRDKLGLMSMIPPEKAITESRFIMDETGFPERLMTIRSAYEKKNQKR